MGLATEMRIGMHAHQQEDGSFNISAEDFESAREDFYKLQAEAKVNDITYDGIINLSETLRNALVEQIKDYYLLHTQIMGIRESGLAIADENDRLSESLKIETERLQSIYAEANNLKQAIDKELFEAVKNNENLEGGYAIGYDNGFDQAVKMLKPLVEKILNDSPNW